jgi:predicted CopG family antitoxin
LKATPTDAGYIILVMRPDLSSLDDPAYVDWVPHMPQVILLYNLYKIIMLATKRVAVTEPVWAELSDLRRPGETFSQLLAEMIEREKKTRLVEHLKHIADEGNFVELPP